MAFQTLEVGLELVRSLRAVLEQLMRVDPKLADDLRRAARSVPQNIAEGSRRSGRDRLHHYRIAAGSADETRTALRVAEALGLLTQEQVEAGIELADRSCALLWRLTHPR